MISTVRVRGAVLSNVRGRKRIWGLKVNDSPLDNLKYILWCKYPLDKQKMPTFSSAFFNRRVVFSAKSCPTLCNPMDSDMPDFSVFYYLCFINIHFSLWTDIEVFYFSLTLQLKSWSQVASITHGPCRSWYFSAYCTPKNRQHRRIEQASGRVNIWLGGHVSHSTTVGVLFVSVCFF